MKNSKKDKKEIKEDASTTQNTPGMGNVSLPSGDSTGSGDTPARFKYTFDLEEFLEKNVYKQKKD